MDNYELGEMIGRGGMGLVYRARQKRLDRGVAIKFIRAHVADDPEAEERFLREARLIAKIDHPNVVRIHDTGVDESGRPYIVMELLEGEPLRQRLARGPLAEPRALEIAIQVLFALEAAHERGIVHRDITPGNIYLCANGTVKLVDFGIAKASSGTRLTETGVQIGTPEYMSPEQADGIALDCRSDLYSLGIVIYEMLSGDVPFKADTPSSVLYQHVHRAPPNLEAVSPRTAKVLASSLAKRPEDRFPNARAMRLAVLDALRGQPAGVASRPEAEALARPGDREPAKTQVLAPKSEPTPQAPAEPPPTKSAGSPTARGRHRRGQAVGVALAGMALGALWLVPRCNQPQIGLAKGNVPDAGYRGGTTPKLSTNSKPNLPTVSSNPVQKLNPPKVEEKQTHTPVKLPSVKMASKKVITHPAPKFVFCTNCGKKNDADAKHCVFCGALIPTG